MRSAWSRPGGRGGGGQGADRGVEQLGDLVDARGQLVELAQQQPGQPGVVVGEPAVQGPFQGGPPGAGPAPGQLGQHLRAALPGDQRLDHRPAGHPEHVGEHRGDLDQGVLEQLLDPLLDPGAVLDQVEPGPGQIPHLAHRLGGHQRRGQHRPLGELGQPHRVDLVGLRAARDVLHLRGVDQPHRQPGRLEQVVERAPVIRGGLQHHPGHPLAAQMITELDQRRGGRRDRPDLGHPPARDRLVRDPQAHHPAGLGHVDRRDPLHDLFVLVDLHLDRLLHRLVLLSGVASPGGAARGDRWDSQNLTGVLVATVRNPSKGPGARLSNGLQCQRNDGVGRAAPHQGFHARAAPHRGMRTEMKLKGEWAGDSSPAEPGLVLGLMFRRWR